MYNKFHAIDSCLIPTNISVRFRITILNNNKVSDLIAKNCYVSYSCVYRNSAEIVLVLEMADIYVQM